MGAKLCFPEEHFYFNAIKAVAAAIEVPRPL